jgi:hypothetical protein
MFSDKIRNILPKKLLVYPFILLFAVAVTLAFIPHYSCACADDGSIQQVAKRSKLEHYAIQIIENIGDVVRSISK